MSAPFYQTDEIDVRNHVCKLSRLSWVTGRKEGTHYMQLPPPRRLEQDASERADAPGETRRGKTLSARRFFHKRLRVEVGLRVHLQGHKVHDLGGKRESEREWERERERGEEKREREREREIESIIPSAYKVSRCTAPPG